jgi:hypothetical protein
MDNLLYALAPAGATHTAKACYRKYNTGSDEWFGWDDDYEEWDFIKHPSPHGYTPIPARELEINRLADTVDKWTNDKTFTYTTPNFEEISYSEWQSRRALRIEHGLIATLTDEGAKDAGAGSPLLKQLRTVRRMMEKGNGDAKLALSVIDKVIDSMGTKESVSGIETPDTAITEYTDSQWVPEVGQWCEVATSQGFFKCLIIGRDEALFIFRSSGGYPHGAYDGATLGCFRPIKTEREIFVEIVVENLIELDSDNWTHDANFIYDWLVGKGVDLSPLLEGNSHE